MRASYAAFCAVILLILMAGANVSEAATCNPSELSPCVGAISSSGQPSSLCCSKLKAQKPCLCQYIRDPTLKQFVNSPGARKVAQACGVPIPKC